MLCVKLILAKLATSENVGKDTYSAALQYEIECTEKYLDAISSDTYAEVDKLKAKIERIKAEKGNSVNFLAKIHGIWRIFAENFRKGVLARVKI